MNFPFSRVGLTFTLSMPVPTDIYQVQNWCRDQSIKSVVLGDHAAMEINAEGAPVLVPVPGYILTIICASTHEADLLEAQNLIGFEPKEPEEPTPPNYE